MVAPREPLSRMTLSEASTSSQLSSEVAAHLGAVDLVVHELALPALVEVGAIRARLLQPAAADDEVPDMVEGDQPLILADAALLRAGLAR